MDNNNVNIIKSSYRLQYYEDDVVVYTKSGKHPKIPEKYQYCIFYWNHTKRKFKAFYTRQLAEIALRYTEFKTHFTLKDTRVIFYCPKCCMYHMTSERNYRKYVQNKK